ncbi:MAG: hypothetical protein DBX47_03330 [Clostridiales bacterium]|nr:MAG: hypothetical protein DBX47_03330 [Clostridiales bacterium]
MDVCAEFYTRIEGFVADILDGYIPQKTGEKTIHDPIWGSVLYYGWEIELIDSPVFQRLRDIQQLGRADLTYPAARHTRFEHSLGTVAIASRMIDNLRTRSNDYIISDSDKNKIRLAALLHDIGHCFYSHLSERVYSKMAQFKAIRKELMQNFDKGVNPKPHELFSYMLVKSETFGNFFFEYISYPDKGDRESCFTLLSECANIIVGQNNKKTVGEKTVIYSFLTSVLNSDFDADKLDYTQRDSYTAGLSLTYGVERFLMKLVIHCEETKDTIDYRLAIRDDGVTTVEELIFNRNMLYVYMYRHQKVLAVESLIEDIIYLMIADKKLVHPCDFLYLSDKDIEYKTDETTLLGSRVIKLRHRATPKRACVISSEDIGDRRAVDALTKSMNFSNFEQRLELRRQICEAIKTEYADNNMSADFDEYDIFPVFPKITDGRAQFLVVSRDGKKPVINKFVYIKEWSRAFNLSNWRGYVFVDTKINRDVAGSAVIKFLKGYTK